MDEALEAWSVLSIIIKGGAILFMVGLIPMTIYVAAGDEEIESRLITGTVYLLVLAIPCLLWYYV